MKHKLNKILSLFIAMLVCVCAFTIVAPSAHAVTTSGSCGDSLLWNLSNGTLTISGTGAMSDYDEFTPAPWSASAASIQRVVIGDGVTHVGNMAFYHLPVLVTVTLPTTVASVGDLAFAGCYALAQISLPAVQSIGWGAFYDCRALTNLYLPQSLATMGEKAFYRCSSLAGIVIPASVQSMGGSCFTYCTSLVYVRVEAPLAVLPAWSFYGCDLLTELSLPETITTIESDALSDCSSLTVVDYDGDAATKDVIRQQLADKNGLAESDSYQDVTFSQTDGASISTTNTNTFVENGGITTDTHVNATVTDSTGWGDVAQSVTDTMNDGAFPTVDVQLQGDAAMPENTLDSLADRDVTVNIHTDQNVDWQVIMGDQTADSLDGEQNFNVQITGNTSDKFADTLGDSESYSVTLGDTTLNSTILFPLGNDSARRTATLYRVNGGKLEKLSSVIVDDDGKAAFSLAGTKAGEYILALDVPEIPQEEVRIPEKLASQYDITYGATLTDAYGNQYVLTGRVNKLGISAGTLGLIVLGVLFVSTLLVGAVMVIWNRQRKNRFVPPRT